MGGKENKEPIFKIGTTTSEGSINVYGASFSGETHDDLKFATITIALPKIEGDVVDFVAEKVGVGIINLNKLEDSIEDALLGVSAERAEVMANISVA